MRNYCAEKIASRNYEVPAIGAPPPLPEAPEQIDFSSVCDYRSLQPQDNRAAVSGWCTIVSIAILAVAFAFHHAQALPPPPVSDGSTDAQWNKYQYSLQQAKQQPTEQNQRFEPAYAYGSEQDVVQWLMDTYNMTRPAARQHYNGNGVTSPGLGRRSPQTAQ
jgi:hypothetical protein